MKQAKATFKIKNWDEKPVQQVEGLPKVTHASVTQSFEGDIQGEAAIEYVMSYRDDGSASYVGLQRVIGTLGGRKGSFVLLGRGGYEQTQGKATMTWSVAPGSGTGDLKGITGEGSAVATHEPPGSLTLSYDFE
ncbi:MAG TPA: DUF3224 domain-containing protein [Candidatus Eisenbacteria bacterium]|nr:DUF3224 domain-containing protein [Candidatus Eisenbacteria bacterium]